MVAVRPDVRLILDVAVRKNPRISPWMSDKKAIALLREAQDVRLYSGMAGKDDHVLHSLTEEQRRRYEEELVGGLVRQLLQQMARHEYLRAAKLHLDVEMRCSEEYNDYSGCRVLRAHLIVRDKT